MKLGGYRRDGTLRVLIPGGMTVVLKGDLASPPLDDAEADRLGPWIEPDSALSWQERQELGKRLDRARTVPAHAFALQFPFPKKEPAEAKTEVAAPIADGESGGPAPKSKPLTKGDLLARITDIAKAKEKEKEDEKAEAEKAVPKVPRSVMKRLKLEFESEDREGDEKKDKPVSDVAEATQNVPDHLQPMNFGGPGSGNFGHAGRPGEQGGSSGDGGGGDEKRPQGDIDRDKARWKAEDTRSAMETRKAEREEGWTADSPEGRSHVPSSGHFAHEGRAGGAAGSKYWSKLPAEHQNAFASRVLDATKDGQDISAVTTATPTPTGVRFKTVDGHAANAIGRVADRAGHRNTHRYDNETGHYIVHVNTATKKANAWK